MQSLVFYHVPYFCCLYIFAASKLFYCASIPLCQDICHCWPLYFLSLPVVRSSIIHTKPRWVEGYLRWMRLYYFDTFFRSFWKVRLRKAIHMIGQECRIGLGSRPFMLSANAWFQLHPINRRAFIQNRDPLQCNSLWNFPNRLTLRFSNSCPNRTIFKHQHCPCQKYASPIDKCFEDKCWQKSMMASYRVLI